MKGLKKILSVILCIVMIFGSAPLAGFVGLEFSGNDAFAFGIEHLETVPEGYTGIYTIYDFDNIRDNPSGNYILMNDLEFTEEDFSTSGDFYNGGFGWLGIQDFSGIFNGNNYEISGIIMIADIESNISEKTCGVFSTNSGQIINLGLQAVKTDLYFAAPAAVLTFGCLVGENSGTVDNCYCYGEADLEAYGVARASYATHASLYAGSIVGVNAEGAFINNSFSNVAISGTAWSGYEPYLYVGGICGINSGTVSYSYSVGSNYAYTAPIKCISIYVGGVCGKNNNHISNCFSISESKISVDNSVNVNYYSYEYIGGISGSNDGTIEQCFNRGNVFTSLNLQYGASTTNGTPYSTDYCGGISGYGTGSVINCYNSGLIYLSALSTYSYTGSHYLGGISGSGNTVAYCYNAGKIKSEQIYSGDPIIGDVGGILGKGTSSSSSYYIDSCVSGSTTSGEKSVKCTSDEMTKQETFTDFDFETIWFLDDADGYYYPKLRSLPERRDIPATYFDFVTDEIDIVIGKKTHFNTIIEPTNTTDKIQYTSSDENILSISDAGVATANNVGTVTVTAVTSSGLTAECVVNVKLLTYKLTWDLGDEVISYDVEAGKEFETIESPEREGYTFSGWSTEIPQTMPYEDLTITALWEAIPYKIKWIIDGVTLTQTKYYGDSVEPPYEPEKVGYTFAGWSPELPESMSAEDMTFTATWISNLFTVTWNIDGVKTTEQYADGDTIIAPQTPEKEGYTFVGWSPEIPETMPKNDIEFVATWTPNKYKIRWIISGVTFTQTIKYDEEIIPPDNPEMEGYDFVGWTDEIPNTMPSHDLEFIAEWEPSTHNISWISDGEEIITTSVKYSEAIVEPESPVKEGYVFVGWTPSVPTVMPDFDLVFTAVWAVDYGVILSLDNHSSSLSLGESRQLNITFEPVPEQAPDVVWSSGNLSIASVDENGIVTALSCGTTTITADIGNGITGEIAITVNHDYTSITHEATCTDDGWVLYNCKNCHDTYTVITDKAVGTHDYDPTTFYPTCIQPGCNLNICKRCGIVSKTDITPAKGHSFNDWNVKEEATEENEGLEQRNCKNCGYTEEKILPMLNRTTYNVTFRANGQTVAVVEYVKGATSIEEPPVPHKDRFAGRWSDYTLDDSDITVEAIYDVIDVDNLSGIDYGKSATYNASTGVATVNLYAASEAKTVVSTTSEKVPLDIVLVVDQSGSMDEKLGGSTTKKQALINSATSFVNLVYEDASANGVDHRIAIVGFGMGNRASGAEYPAYLNTEILTTGSNPIQMNNATSDDYANALMSVDVSGLNPDITKAINNIDAKGATAADYGLSMANNIFANNTDNGGRERIVVFMTDGAPTYSSNFSKDVANAAILHANELKNTYNATVYSIGVMSKSDTSYSDTNRFMNYVSSNYADAKSVSGSYHQQSSEYYLNVTNTNALSGIFEEIVIENITRTTDFDNITVIDTVSKHFTLTTQQEKALRVNVIETYGVRNQDITVTRNDDGTTLIVIENIHPVDDGEKFVVDITFEVSADEDAATAGVYPTNTADAGIIIGDTENYECVFTTPYITVPSDRATAVFKVNGEIYAVKTILSGDSVTTPETDFEGDHEFSGWDLTADSIDDGYAEFDATYASQEYVVIWNTDEGTVRETYNPGDVINEPAVAENSRGDAFRRWNGDVPVTMSAVSIEFTAVYGDHEHNYVAETVTEMTCLSDGLMKYTCSVCGDSYTEIITCYGEHSWKVVASVAGDEANYETLECENCGETEERKLEYTFVDEEENERGYKEHVTHDFNLVDGEGNHHQPESDINISMPVDEHYGNVFDMNVYRVDENGNEIECNSDYDNGVVSFDADHFSTYIFVPVHFCSINDNHIDTDENNYCDTCDEMIVELYTVNWVVDGETVLAYSCAPDTETVIPDDPEKEGSTFAGWSPEVPATVSDSDLTFVATWETVEHECIGVLVGACDATCTRNGHTGNTYCSTCGTLMQQGETISKTGHTYGEWSEWKSSKTNYSSRYRDCETCGNRDVETKYVGGSGKYVSFNDFMNWIFAKIFNLIFGWTGIDFSTKFN